MGKADGDEQRAAAEMRAQIEARLQALTDDALGDVVATSRASLDGATPDAARRLFVTWEIGGRILRRRRKEAEHHAAN